MTSPTILTHDGVVVSFEDGFVTVSLPDEDGRENTVALVKTGGGWNVGLARKDDLIPVAPQPSNKQ